MAGALAGTIATIGGQALTVGMPAFPAGAISVLGVHAIGMGTATIAASLVSAGVSLEAIRRGFCSFRCIATHRNNGRIALGFSYLHFVRTNCGAKLVDSLFREGGAGHRQHRHCYDKSLHVSLLYAFRSDAAAIRQPPALQF